MTEEPTKDLVFPEPRVPYAYSESGTAPRGWWTVAEVEEVMWRVRAAGGTDSTPVKFQRGEIRATHVVASEHDAPHREEPAPPPPAAPAPMDVLSPRLRRFAEVVGLLLALPVVLWAVVLVWRLTVGSLF